MTDEDDVEEVVLPVIHCTPAEPALLARMNASLPPERQWHPSILHAITQCDRCGRDCWIGPRQKALAQSGISKQCSICIVLAGEAMGAQYDVYGLNPNEEDVPRRT